MKFPGASPFGGGKDVERYMKEMRENELQRV